MELDAADLDLDNSSEKLFVFHESVSTLQYIASHTAALQLWHHYVSRAKCSKIQKESYDLFKMVLNLDEDYKRESKKLAKQLKTPQRIEEILKKSLERIYLETSRWINDFKYKIFTGQISRYCPRNFDLNHIVWRPNGEIDCKRSASKMLTKGKLNAEQKFVLMCSYVMAEELERFPMDSLSELFQWLGISDLKTAYWICEHRCDLREIWLRMPDMIRHGNTSINVIMAMEYGSRQGSGSIFPHIFEHFWNRLREDEQLSLANEVVNVPQWRELQKIMLSTVSPFQQRQLVDRIPLEFMKRFCTVSDTPENAFIIWTRIKDRITEQQFVRCLKTLFDRAMYLYSEENWGVKFTNVWDTASDRLKRHIAESNPDIILSPFMRKREAPSPSIYRFVMKFLPLVNEHIRKQIIFSIADIDIARTQDIDFLNLCLPEEADQLQLKNQIMESDSMLRYCAKTLNCMDFDNVINTVAFFSPNAHDSFEFFKKLLDFKGVDAEKFILNYENWNKLSNFMDTVLTNYLSTIPELKKKIVSCFSARVVHCCNDEEENLNALIKITEQVFSFEEMKTFKQTMLEHFKEMTSTRWGWIDFKGKCYNALVTWCSEDESRIIDFKKIVRIDAFFNDIFHIICSSADSDPEYQIRVLDQYLRNFCSSDEEVLLLKVRKYYERDRYWIGEVNRIFPLEIQGVISDWFFSVEKS